MGCCASRSGHDEQDDDGARPEEPPVAKGKTSSSSSAAAAPRSSSSSSAAARKPRRPPSDDDDAVFDAVHAAEGRLTKRHETFPVLRDGQSITLTIDYGLGVVREGALKETAAAILERKRLRIFPFETIVDVRRDRRETECALEVVVGRMDMNKAVSSGADVLHYTVAGGMDATAVKLMRELNAAKEDVEDAPLLGTTVNFGVLKLNPRGNYQQRLMCIDVARRRITNAHKGSAHSTFQLAYLMHAGPTDDMEEMGIHAEFFGARPHTFIFQSFSERDTVLAMMKAAVAGRDPFARENIASLSVVGAALWPPVSRPAHEGVVKKKGGMGWDERYLALKQAGILFVFRRRPAQGDLPLNVISLTPSASIEPGDDFVTIAVKAEHRSFSFRCETERECNAWLAALRSAKDDAAFSTAADDVTSTKKQRRRGQRTLKT